MTTTAHILPEISLKKAIQDNLYLHGNFSLAYHTLQPQLSHFVTKEGYIAYIEFRNETIVLGDPIADESQFENIINQFLMQRPTCSFIQAGANVARILSKRNFSVDCFGVESQIALPYQMHGKQKREIRNLTNVAKKKNVIIKEVFNRNLLFKNSVQEQKNKFEIIFPFNSKREYSFLSRPLTDSDEFGVRIFGGYVENQLICYSVFDPIYQNEKIIGYAESIARQSSSAIKGARTYTLIEAMKQFTREEITFVNIGLLPFYVEGVSNEFEKYSNLIVAKIFSMLYKSSPLVSNFAGLSFHKSRYRGKHIPKYFISNAKKKHKVLLSIYQLTTGKKIPLI